MRHERPHRLSMFMLIITFSLTFNIILVYIHTQSPRDLGISDEDLEELCCKAKKRKAGVRYLCPFYQGGLGNHMFQFASIYGIADKRGFHVGLFKDSLLYKYFDFSLPHLKYDKTCTNAKPVQQIRACAFDNDTLYFNDDCQSNYHIRSYLQSWKYFEHKKDEIRKYFKFKNEIQQKAIDLIKRSLNMTSSQGLDDVTIVGLHVRRGDYLTVNNSKYGYNVASKDYVNKAMAYYREKYYKPRFLIFVNKNDDDLAWCRNNTAGDDVFFAINDSPGVALCMLSTCNHTIMTVGTFGWWGSWLSKGTTIYFKDVAKNNTSFRAMFSEGYEDFFYPGWLGMS